MRGLEAGTASSFGGLESSALLHPLAHSFPFSTFHQWQKAIAYTSPQFISPGSVTKCLLSLFPCVLFLYDLAPLACPEPESPPATTVQGEDEKAGASAQLPGSKSRSSCISKVLNILASHRNPGCLHFKLWVWGSRSRGLGFS